jgi:phage shock protein PspC (stress-responsive transcriptional regulator)
MVKPTDFWEGLRALRKSSRDKKIAGVGGGFGKHTPVWIWRALFLIPVFVWGIGLVAYVVLWICMPAADESAKDNER